MKKNLIIVLICFWHVALAEPNKTEFTPLLITPQSVGLINQDTKFDRKIIAQALPGYKITEQTEKVDQKEQIYFKLHRKGQSQLTIHLNSKKQKISRIRITDVKALAPNKTKIGSAYADVFGDGKTANCQAGIVAGNAPTTCAFAKNSNIRYSFELEESDTDEIILPNKALNQARLIAIIWTPEDKSTKNKRPPLSVTASNSKQIMVKAAAVKKYPALKSTIVKPAVEVKIAYERQEKRLNDAYSHFNVTLIKLKAIAIKSSKNTDVPDKLSDFINAQRAWKQYRDNNCYWHSSLTDDSLKKMVCLERMTRERATEIEQIQKQLEQL